MQVHRGGVRAGELAGTPRVYEATMDQDEIRSMLHEAVLAQGEPQLAEMAEQMLADGGPHMGLPADRITTRVDVTPWIERKRAALAAHASQVPADSWFLSVPPDVFTRMFGTECFVHRGVPAATREGDLGLAT